MVRMTSQKMGLPNEAIKYKEFKKRSFELKTKYHFLEEINSVK